MKQASSQPEVPRPPGRPAKPVDYLVIKQRRQNLPIRWYLGQDERGTRAP